MQPFAILRGHTDGVFSVAWLNSSALASGSHDNTIQIWKPFETEQPIITLRSHTDGVNSMAWNPSRMILAAGLTQNGTIRVLQMRVFFDGLGCALNCDSEPVIHVQSGGKDFPDCGAPMQRPCATLPYAVARAPPLGTVKIHSTVLDERSCSFGIAKSLAIVGVDGT